ncbi:MAG: hypothetical protein WCV56_05115 [Candidatus Omnitrophota bacterium]
MECEGGKVEILTVIAVSGIFVIFAFVRMRKLKKLAENLADSVNKEENTSEKGGEVRRNVFCRKI